MTYYLGLDLGTGSLKTVLFDVNGLEIAASAVEYPLYQPHNGWSEQNPEDWYTLPSIASLRFMAVIISSDHFLFGISRICVAEASDTSVAYSPVRR